MENNTSLPEVYNLIILDESGSMHCVWDQTISGCNETLNTIRQAQEQFKDSQKYYVSIYAFQDGVQPSRYLIKNVPGSAVEDITRKDYCPGGMTNLNDAVGITLTEMKATCAAHPGAIANVTIITDGMENASKEYRTSQVAQMIKELNELGWSFNFIGANIDVQGTSARYNIDSSMSFVQDAEGMREMFRKERTSRMKWFGRKICLDKASTNMSREEYVESLKNEAKDYFNDDEE